MREKDLLELLTGQRTGVIQVCTIRHDIARLVGAFASAIWLSDYTVRKQETKHHHADMRLYRLAPTIIREGFIRVQPPHHLIFIHHDDAEGRSFRAAVKATRDGRELYLVSVHQIDQTGVRATYTRTISVRDWEAGRREVGPPGNPTLRSEDE